MADGLAVSIWQPGDRCREVPSLLAVDIDPERQRFSIHNYAEEGLVAPLTIDDWQTRTGHLLLFNAGLFRVDFSYLGLLYHNGAVGGRTATRDLAGPVCRRADGVVRQESAGA